MGKGVFWVGARRPGGRLSSIGGSLRRAAAPSRISIFLLPAGLSSWSLLLPFGDSEALVDLVPVHDIPPGREIVGPLVLILEVVGVLPDVVAQDRIETLSERGILI